MVAPLPISHWADPRLVCPTMRVVWGERLWSLPNTPYGPAFFALPCLSFPICSPQPLPEEALGKNFQTHKDDAMPPLPPSSSCQCGPSARGPRGSGNSRFFSDHHAKLGAQMVAIPSELGLDHSHHPSSWEPSKILDTQMSPPPQLCPHCIPKSCS